LITLTIGVIEKCCTLVQGRNEVRWRPGKEANLGSPWSALTSFGSKCTVLKNVLATLLGRFGAPRTHSAPPTAIRRPHSDSAPGES